MKEIRKSRFAVFVSIAFVLLGVFAFELFQGNHVFAEEPLIGEQLEVAKLIGGAEQTTKITDIRTLLSEFGVVTVGDYTVKTADTEGAIAVGGNLVVENNYNYSVGTQATGLAALINGTVEGQSGFNNKAIAVGTDSGTISGCSKKYIIGANTVVDFSALKGNLIKFSEFLATKNSAGATAGRGELWAGMEAFTVEYSGSDTDIYVTLTDDDIDLFSSSDKVNYKIPAGTRVILSYTGTKEVTMPTEAYINGTQIAQDSAGDAAVEANRRILYNFTNTNSVVLKMTNSGTVMAPKASGTSAEDGGHISGQFIFDTFSPDAEVGARGPFDFTTISYSSEDQPEQPDQPDQPEQPDQPDQPEPAAKGNLEAVVIDSVTGEVVPDAKVVVTDEKGTTVLESKTDENGKISVKDLEAGNYTITVTEIPEGYNIDTSDKTVTVVENKTVQEEFRITKSETSPTPTPIPGGNTSDNPTPTLSPGTDTSGSSTPAPAGGTTSQSTNSSSGSTDNNSVENSSNDSNGTSEDEDDEEDVDEDDEDTSDESVYNSNKETDVNVKTGDDFNLVFFFVVFAVSGVLLPVLGKRRKRV